MNNTANRHCHAVLALPLTSLVALSFIYPVNAADASAGTTQPKTARHSIKGLKVSNTSNLNADSGGLDKLSVTPEFCKATLDKVGKLVNENY